MDELADEAVTEAEGAVGVEGAQSVQQSNALRVEIDGLVHEGYRVVSETETSAQLVQPKPFSFGWAFIWFLLLGFGVLVYAFYYMAKTDKAVYLTVAADGSVRRGEPVSEEAFIPNCRSCGFSIPGGANFCPSCGRPAPLTNPLSVTKVPWTFLDMGKAIGFIIAGVLLSFIPLVIGIYLVAGSNPDENDPTYLTVSIASSVVLQLLMIASVVRFGIGKYHAPRSALGLRKPDRGGYWLPIPLVLSAYAIMVVYFSILSAFDINPNSDLPDGTFDNIGPIIAVAVLSLVFAPICEETFFRGYIFGGLRNQWGGLWAALASGLLFGLVHGANPGGLYIIPPIAAIGAMFAGAYIYSGSIRASIGAHFLFNLTSFAIGLLGA